MSNSSHGAAVAELTLDHIREALKESEKPRNAKWIAGRMPKAMRATPNDVTALLSASSLNDRVFPFVSAAEVAYWQAPPEEYVRIKLLLKAQSGPRTKAEILRSVAKMEFVHGVVAKSAVEKMFNRLVDEDKVQQYPPLVGARTKLFGVGELDPEVYARDALQKLVEKLKLPSSRIAEVFTKVAGSELARCAVVERTETEVGGRDVPLCDHQGAGSVSAVSCREDATDERIVEMMREINPDVDRGDIVSLPELRRRLELSFPDKGSFDAAILQLVANRVLAIHPCDHALTEADRGAFVQDERGVWYNVVSLRSRS